jgi:hypothetical protein
MSPAIGLYESGAGPCCGGGSSPPELPKAGGLEACAAAFTRLRPRRVFAPGFSKDGAAPHLLKQRPKGEPCRRKIGDRRAFSDGTGTVFRDA